MNATTIKKRFGWKASSPWRSGFSLIEMLVVIVIILILSGIVYRISSFATRRAGRARTVYELELLHNIMEEYYAVYGHYPPTSGNIFIDHQNETRRNVYPPTWGEYLRDPLIGPNMPVYDPAAGLSYFTFIQYNFGLVPQEEVNAFRNRWAHFFNELHTIESVDIMAPVDTTRWGQEGGTLAYSNFNAVIMDPYGNEWQYIGHAPDYQSYLLYSMGPDGVGGNEDDIGRDRWSE